jgi:hypothetical protein
VRNATAAGRGEGRRTCGTAKFDQGIYDRNILSKLLEKLEYIETLEWKTPKAINMDGFALRV